MPISLPESSPLWLIILVGFGALATIGVGAYRKWKAGEIEDDGVLIDRMNADNINLREQLSNARKETELMHVLFDDERAKRRHAEDAAEIYYRQLRSAGIEPQKVNPHG